VRSNESVVEPVVESVIEQQVQKKHIQPRRPQGICSEADGPVCG